METANNASTMTIQSLIHGQEKQQLNQVIAIAQMENTISITHARVVLKIALNVITTPENATHVTHPLQPLLYQQTVNAHAQMITKPL